MKSHENVGCIWIGNVLPEKARVRNTWSATRFSDGALRKEWL